MIFVGRRRPQQLISFVGVQSRRIMEAYVSELRGGMVLPGEATHLVNEDMEDLHLCYFV
jgi:hypothetical protein